MPTLGTMISYPTSDGQAANAYEVPSGSSSKNVLIVIHEAWGLNDGIKRSAEKLASELGPDARVIALDLFDGRLIDTIEQLTEFRKTWPAGRAEAIVRGALDYAGEDANIATLGWCMGGMWSLRTALTAGSQCSACVAYYGTMITDPAQLAPLNAPVLAIFGKLDQHITQEHARAFQAAMHEAGKSVTVLSYDADHAFANEGRPRYNAEAAADANAKALAFLREHWLKRA